LFVCLLIQRVFFSSFPDAEMEQKQKTYEDKDGDQGTETETEKKQSLGQDGAGIVRPQAARDIDHLQAQLQGTKRKLDSIVGPVEFGRK
jgi:hypothetical protein